MNVLTEHESRWTDLKPTPAAMGGCGSSVSDYPSGVESDYHAGPAGVPSRRASGQLYCQLGRHGHPLTSARSAGGKCSFFSNEGCDQIRRSNIGSRIIKRRCARGSDGITDAINFFRIMLSQGNCLPGGQTKVNSRKWSSHQKRNAVGFSGQGQAIGANFIDGIAIRSDAICPPLKTA